ncbi:hypothetical protein T4D_16082 [Trichinella pseudospiralis]|uniref:Uncharacterized protein n=1 Tax=Trichinella pseudospiralis TaxID=6337 RepID=A0A0V1G164_TRIPS|nr:hypothetical protein T4D_16082 [Trichinella pseudospiralis]
MHSEALLEFLIFWNNFQMNSENKFVPYLSKDDVKLVELMTVMPFLQKKYLVVALSQWPLARDNSNDVDKNYMKATLFMLLLFIKIDYLKFHFIIQLAFSMHLLLVVREQFYKGNFPVMTNFCFFTFANLFYPDVSEKYFTSSLMLTHC